MLRNKVILLTGGVDGIGWECAKAYAHAGAQVCILDKNPLPSHKKEQLPSLLHFEGSVAIEADVQNCIAMLIKKWGQLDAIHNNAGIAAPSKPLDTTLDTEWELLFDVNLKSILYTTRYGLPHLKTTQGSILNTSSLVGSIGQQNHAAYVATKGAVNALTKAMALDYAPMKIRVNAVAPAAINTPTLQAWSQEQPNATMINDYLNRLQPLGNMPQGDVIADACTFLLSNKARFITGCILPVSGGAELGYRL